nr:hypothetical protein Hi04_10k_c5981_00032 [uncultured bacterium]
MFCRATRLATASNPCENTGHMVTESANSRLGRAWDTATILLIYAAVVLPGFLRNAPFSDNRDEIKYHLPAIKQFAAQLPYPNLRAYSSATTPLYHLIMAVLLRAGCGLMTLRVINLGLSVATLLIVIAYFQRASANRSDWTAFSAGLLFAICLLFVGPSLRLSTDNLPFGCAVAILYMIDRDEKLSASRFALAVFLAVVAVLTRQLYLWLVPLLGLYALMNDRWSLKGKLIAASASLIPLLSVLPFFLLWHGLINPQLAHKHVLRTGFIYGKGVVLIFCILATYATAFAPVVIRALWPEDARGLSVLVFTFVVAIAVLPTFHAYAGSYSVPTEGGWIRAAAEYTPAVFHIWSLFWILFPLGCVVLAAMSYHTFTTGREVWILAAFGVWMLANVMQSRATAKYFEPFEIVVVGRFAATIRSQWWENIPVWMLTALFFVVDIFRFWFGSPWASPPLPR